MFCGFCPRVLNTRAYSAVLQTVLLLLCGGFSWTQCRAAGRQLHGDLMIGIRTGLQLIVQVAGADLGCDRVLGIR